ncbi:ATP-binding cassette sub-family C member 10 [Leptopilina boulardi]|uniref:ATP-binding cassette sub-family C member 10 n=1 Tax=Leptopilina boulardi TaxID=63433 RepID=UPI0021F653E7|nr:ATP-binding cassette sub-family C member 10 [Leptopilina boulardi]XP_051169844.1 ATP-binding cassette sub-family C member 10 [Leptopilina boulardi]XP_051169845.1 ATP-binding cassette sub-family C member 10 [Leptopilina boulardi]
MENLELVQDSGGSWKWNWTELCGYQGSIRPLNPETHNIGLCFQQLYLQIPVLVLIAITSAYYCGRQSYSISREYFSTKSINFRLLLIFCLGILPIIKAYIILSNTTLSVNLDLKTGNNLFQITTTTTTTPIPIFSNWMKKIEGQLNDTQSVINLFLLSEKHGNVLKKNENKIYDENLLKLDDKATSAKPVDYLVAGTEGLAWIVHFCFTLSLRKSIMTNPRGPIFMRVLIILLLGISALFLKNHIDQIPQDDVLPNLSLGFSITNVVLLILYIFTLIPDRRENSRRRTSRFADTGERTSLINSPGSSYIRFVEENDPSYLGVAMESVPFTSKLLFHWVTPLMSKGVKGLLNQSDDLYDLPDSISSTTISNDIDKRLKEIPLNKQGNSQSETNVEFIKTSKISLLRILHSNFGFQFYAIGLLKLIADCAGFAGPIILNKLLGFIENKNEPIQHGYFYASLMFLITLIGTFCNVHFNFWLSIITLKMRSAIITLVYRKTLHTSASVLNENFSSGEIVNFMSLDSDRIMNFCPSFHALWSVPIQLSVIFYFLHNQIGISFLVGVAVSIVMIPINKYIANKMGRLSTKMMSFKDQRVRIIAETLRGITTIKLNVWEDHFMRNIMKLREKEVKYLSGRKYLDALCVYFWAATQVFISVFTFITYVLLGNELDAKTVFTTMALMNMLITPLNMYPWVFIGLTESWVSIKRIQRLLDLPEADIASFYSDPPIGVDVMVKNTTFSTRSDLKNENSPSTSRGEETERLVRFEDEKKQIFSLSNLEFIAEKGQLIGIMGRVGCGKSLLLDGILGEITKEEGIVAVNNLEKGFGFVKQIPWIQRGTIRENILFGKPYDHNKYKSIIRACALTDDLNTFPKKDLSGVGEAGMTLSGGQKTRITLARAIYADKDIYLLDDILATLDMRVAKHIFNNVILGLLKNKTRIMCTHQTQYLIHADTVVEVSKGKILKQGKPSEILADLDEFLLSTESMEIDLNSITGKKRKIIPKELDELNDGDRDSLLEDETLEKGTLQFSVYESYFKAIGHYFVIAIFLAMFLMQSSRNVTDLWLSFWVTHNNDTNGNSTNSSNTKLIEYLTNGENTNVKYYLTIYAALAILNSFFTLVRAFLFAYGGLKAAIYIQKQLLKVVVMAKSTFFDIQPHGRIINRFSSDTYTVDDSLPFISNILFAQFFGLMGIVIVTLYGLPWIFLVLAPLVPIYNWLQNHYRLTSRELKRLSSSTLSPLYAHFNETLQGLSTIRAFRAVSRFKFENEHFLENSQKAIFASTAAGQWLALRLQFIGVALLGGVCVMAVIQHQYDIADPGLIGLAVTYMLSVSSLLSGLVNAFTETEREMIAVERINQYLDNISVETINGENPPYAWPTQGVVEFRNVVLKYREHLVPSLKGVSFSTRPAEKIGIVGRTGAGKSSILSSLFRLVEISSGEISIDNVNVQNLKLNSLRSRLSIIPQNPFLFSGTIRENIDPLNQYPDSQLCRALEKCKLLTLVGRLGGLGATLDEGGKNLSAGQRQLFCLVRAVLHNARILCIDEATSNVDHETDKAIQATIKSSFRSATVITIAHRIRTIMHCDRVLVMGDGEVLEFEEPNILLQNTNSHFYDLASQEFADRE